MVFYFVPREKDITIFVLLYEERVKLMIGERLFMLDLLDIIIL
jgi:hypothetical protein